MVVLFWIQVQLIYILLLIPNKTLILLRKKSMTMIWEMTQDEYICSMKGKRIEHWYYNRTGQLIHNHCVEVETALQLGKIVPEIVLKDYPQYKDEWKRKYGN